MTRSKGAPPAWVRRRRDENPTWGEALKKYLADQQSKFADDPLYELGQLGCLPLGEALSPRRIEGASGLTAIERMTFALATAHLNSWESWGHGTLKQYGERRAKVEDWNTQHGESHVAPLKALRAYEQARGEHLEKVALWTSESRYRVRPRELRGWARLRDWLKAHPDADAETRKAKLAKLQTELGRGFGGAELLAWLSAPEQQWLADHAEGDVVTRIAVLNALESVVERTRAHPLHTHADARLHPRYAEFDPPKNTNQPPYDLEPDEQRGKVWLKIELLTPTGTGHLERQKHRFLCAPSGQYEEGTIEKIGKRRRLDCRAQDGVGRASGDIGGAALLFDRGQLEKSSAARLGEGELGRVFFKIAVDFGSEHKEALKANRSMGFWLSSALDKRQKSPEKAPPVGTRLLAVDLGLRSAAAISVFQIDAVTTETATLTATHERSALLRLPGEDPSGHEKARRRELDDELWTIRRAVGELRGLSRLARESDPVKRSEQLAGTLSRPLEDQGILAELVDRLAPLSEQVNLAPGDWLERCRPLYRELERRVGRDLSDWRKRTRPKQRRAVGGKSAWAIEHLERVRKTLLSWHRHQPLESAEVQRLDKGRYGTVAKKLLNHVNNLKDDRLKTTADLIVQAARGMVYSRSGWVQKHAPCDLIVMEDLGRYRTRTDRPRAENRQLMQWAHRALLTAVEEQAELYGIAVPSTDAAFSSRFDAMSRAPGIRCRPVTKEDIAQLHGEPEGWLARRVSELGKVELAALQPGDLLPIGGGELLASPRAADELSVRHADVNAAQNLARRFLEGYCVPIKLVAFEASGDGAAFVNVGLGKRAAAALGGKVAVLKRRPHAEVLYDLTAFKTASAAAKELGLKAKAIKESVDQSSEQGELDDLELELEAARDLEASLRKDRKTFFRDPSGAVFSGHWVDGKLFWGQVKRLVLARLRGSSRFHG